ncbi:K1E endosialidase adaptor protein [Vibrio phage vB_VpaP_MGD2]|uniref:K1E endosialidase adaptor protein n=1 Tax=Vibrio phage vB_VpaP_MGD2 TaxID=2565877 RepID=A0A6B7HXA2_9CAUD|nr:K1E endosialidase adaptor protein [Vibrio phage vB_VpaP_MGD2]
MAYSNLSFVRHVGDGVKTLFPLTVAGENMGYFRVEDIHTYVDDKEVPNVIQSQSPHIVSITPAPPAGSDVLIRREMPIEKPYADFSRGNNFGHRQVNNSFLQQLYLTQELIDGFTPKGFYMKQNVDMGGHKHVNLGRGVDDKDSVNMAQYKEHDTRLVSLESSLPSAPSYVVNYRYIAKGGELQLETNRELSYAVLAINGVVQSIGSSFNILGSKIVLAEPLEDGDEVFAILSTPFSTKPVTFDGSTNWWYTASGGETSVNTNASFSSIILTINGIVQIPSKSYEVVGSIIHLAESLEEGDELYAMIVSG